jgi:hypothetical protein
MSRKKIPPLPDVSAWQPRTEVSYSLSTAFLKRCLAIEQRIKLRVQHECVTNIDNFDSGAGVEDIVRDELANLLPNRYAVRSGVLSDRGGQTGGDYDVVIFNANWVPVIKTGAATNSRRVHLPIEGVYTVGEVKQTLNYQTLDAAMEKIVIAQRLFRPPTSATRIVENRELNRCPHGLTNPLYSFVLATQVEKGFEFDEIIRRFVAINQRLRRLEMVRSLCVLGVGTVYWVYRDECGSIAPALFMGDDLHKELHIAYSSAEDIGSAFYPFAENLLLHLYHSILAPEDIPAAYGSQQRSIKISVTEDLTHSSYSRPVDSPSVPWDYEIEIFSSGKVDRLLGAHVSESADLNLESG